MSYNRATQSKAQNESNARTLRALVKQPDNKVCADCKRNDPRWASWNIGCFLCIRCSGIHRSMGTHISKVKSIDLDIWTPEQMAAVQRWGNKRANLYWEAHLKAGHVPPDHKVESFIRSKYELRRWAKDGPVPSDPSVLDGASAAPSQSPAAASAQASAPAKPSQSQPKPSALDLLGGGDDAPAPTAAATTSVSGGSQGGSSLLDDFAAPPAASKTAAAKESPSRAAAPSSASSKPAVGNGGGLFDLDWHDGPTASPATSAGPGPSSGQRGNKTDIMSLYATAKPAIPQTAGSPVAAGSGAAFAGLNASFAGLNMDAKSSSSTAAGFPSDPWSTSSNVQSSSAGAGGFPDPWASSAKTGSAAPPASSNDIWGNPTASFGASNQNTNGSGVKKNDAFDDIWSDFK